MARTSTGSQKYAFYLFANPGHVFTALHPSVVNVIGNDADTGKLYGLGVTSADTAVYMEIESPQSVRVIPEGDWNTIQPTATLPKVISLHPIQGDDYYQISQTSVTVGTITYVGKISIEISN